MAAYWGTIEGVPQRLDDRLNRMMVDFMRDMMATVNTCGVDSMECYYSTAWNDDMIADAVLDGANVELWSVHGPYGKHFDPSSPDEAVRRSSLEGFTSALRFAERIGAKVLVAHPGANIEYDVSLSERLKFAASTLKQVAQIAGGLGISVAVEPLPRNEPGCRLEHVLTVVDEIDMPNVGINFDVNHVFPPEEVPSMIRKAGELILSVHISDQDGQERHWLPFEGLLDWRAILAAFIQVGYSGPLIYETHIRDVANCDAVGRAVADNYAKLRQLEPVREGIRPHAE